MAKFIRPTSTLGGGAGFPADLSAAANDRNAGGSNGSDNSNDAGLTIGITSAPPPTALSIDAQRRRLPVYKQRASQVSWKEKLLNDHTDRHACIHT